MAAELVRLTASPRPLDLLVQLPEGPGAAPPPVVVVCHGFKGFMEWGFFPPLADLLASRGLATVRLNTSGSGMAPGEERASDLAAFAANTYLREVEDVEAVLAALPGLLGERADPSRLALLGHSRGGGVCLLVAARPAWRDRLRALVTWSAIAAADRWDEAARRLWRERGVLEVPNARTGQLLPLGLALLDEVESRREELDLLAAAARRTVPWLVAHGTEDESVPVAEARQLAAAARPPATLALVPGAGHTFGATHPFAGPTPHLATLFEHTQRFLLAHLRR